MRRDDDAFSAFVAGNSRRLRRTAYLLCGDWQLAADITQEALIRVYVAWPRLERSGGLLAYARKAVLSATVDMKRKRSSTEIVAPADDTTPSPDDVEASVVGRESLMKALSALPPRQRACVVLRYFEDLPMAEIAAVLGCREGTAKSQTSRGIATLRRQIEAESGEQLGVDEEVEAR